MSSVSIATNSSTANSCTSLRIEYGAPQGSLAFRFGSQDQASSRAKHDIVVACRRLAEHWWSCRFTGRIHLWCHRSVIAGWNECSMVSTRVLINKHESYSAELVGCRSTTNVCGPGIRRMGHAVSAGVDSRFVRLAWCSSGNARERERDLLCVLQTVRVCTIICWQLGAQQRCKTRGLPSMCSLFESPSRRRAV